MKPIDTVVRRTLGAIVALAMLAGGALAQTPAVPIGPVGRSDAGSSLPTPVSVSNGGTGLSALGSANQCLTTNSGATAMAWQACGSSYTAAANGGLTLSGTAFSLGDSHLSYAAGAMSLTATDNSLGSSGARFGLQLNYTTNDTTVGTGFSDQLGIYSTMTNNAGQNVYGGGTNAKTTFANLLMIQNNYAAGQRVGFAATVNCWGMGDCSAQEENVYFAVGPGAGDEGQAFSHSQNLSQQVTLTLSTISSVPAQSGCPTTTLTQNVAGSVAAQTVTVASSTGCAVGDWVVVNDTGPTQLMNLEAVQLTAVATGSISGIFKNTYTSGEAVAPAVVINTAGGQFGEQRVLVDHTAASYSTGTASGPAKGGGDTFTGVGTSWSTGMVGGSAGNAGPGCVALSADNYTGSPFSGGGINGTLQAWYQILAVASNTSLSIYKTSVANDAAYQGNGQNTSASFTGVIAGTTLTTSAVTGTIVPGQVITSGAAAGTKIVSAASGVATNTWVVSISQTVSSTAMTSASPNLYTISPCARILRVLGSGLQLVLEPNSFTWTASDSIEAVISPYNDSHGIQYDLSVWTPGGTNRDGIDLLNRGAREFQIGLCIQCSQQMQVGGGADTVAFGVGVDVDNAATGFSSGANTPVGLLVGYSFGLICWHTATSDCVAPNATTGGMMLTMQGGAMAPGTQGALYMWGAYPGFANPIQNSETALAFGGSILAQGTGNQTGFATAAEIGFDPGFPGPYEVFRFAKGTGPAGDFVGEDIAGYPSLVVTSSMDMQLWGSTFGTQPSGPGTGIGTVTIFQGAGNPTEPALGMVNSAGTQNVTFKIAAAGALTVGGNGSGASNGSITVGKMTAGSHILALSTSLTISACGTGLPVVAGSDNFGTITTGGGILTSCVVNFGIAWGSAPACTISSASAIASPTVTASTTQLTIGGTSLTSDTITYSCGSVSMLEPANDNALLREFKRV